MSWPLSGVPVLAKLSTRRPCAVQQVGVGARGGSPASSPSMRYSGSASGPFVPGLEASIQQSRVPGMGVGRDVGDRDMTRGLSPRDRQTVVGQAGFPGRLRRMASSDSRAGPIIASAGGSGTTGFRLTAAFCAPR